MPEDTPDFLTISHLEKAEVLCRLYNAARPSPVFGAEAMSLADAEDLVTRCLNFQILDGRALKIHLSGPLLDPREYDLANGPGAAKKALAGGLKTAQLDF